MSQLASNVRFEDEARVVRVIPTGAILTLAMQGITERGPVGSTTLTFDGPDWQSSYGGYTANGNAALVADAFFLNGGTRLRMNRIVHHTDASDPLTKASLDGSVTLSTESLVAAAGSVTSTAAEPYALVDGDTLSFSVDGGGSDVATFNAAAAIRIAGTVETYNLSAGGETLTVEIDSGATQTVTFQTSMFSVPAAATALEVAAAMNAQTAGASVDVSAAAPRITSDRLGTGSGVNVTGGSANTALGFVTGNIAGAGDASDSGLITGAELKTLIEGDVTGVTVDTVTGGFTRVATTTTGASGSIQVEAVSTADDEIGFDNATHSGTDSGAVSSLSLTAKSDGAWSSEVSARVSAPGTGTTGNFKLEVIRSNVAIETWDDLSMDDSSSRYVETILNHADEGSIYIVASDLDAAVSAADQKPAVGTSAAMSGGSDGLAGLADTDFNGGSGVNGDVGLRVFDMHTDIDVLCSPDRATSSHHNSIVTYCDITKSGELFAILDPPEGLTASAMATYQVSTAALFGLSENAAIYWPRVKVSNPNKTVFGQEDKLVVPPCGHLAGLYARVDASKVGGMFEQPAGLDPKVLPRGIVDLETDEVTDLKKRELIFPLNINPISQEEGTPIFVDGARNLDITGSWPSIGEARGVIFVKKRLKPGLAFLRHRNLKPRLYNEGKMSVETFMDSLRDEESFAAYSIDFGLALNNAATRAQRQIKSRLGIDMYGVGEFVIMYVGPDADVLELNA